MLTFLFRQLYEPGRYAFRRHLPKAPKVKSKVMKMYVGNIVCGRRRERLKTMLRFWKSNLADQTRTNADSQVCFKRLFRRCQLYHRKGRETPKARLRRSSNVSGDLDISSKGDIISSSALLTRQTWAPFVLQGGQRSWQVAFNHSVPYSRAQRHRQYVCNLETCERDQADAMCNPVVAGEKEEVGR